MSGGYATGAVKKPIRCPEEGCDVITAVPVDGVVHLTSAAAGFYPSGFRCHRHSCGEPIDTPRGWGPPPPRLTERMAESLRVEWSAQAERRAA